MNILITMAGAGSRFKKAGDAQPKYMIEVKGKTLFEWSMESLAAFRDEYHIFVVRKADGAEGFIREMCDKLVIREHEILEIEELTRGQAETAMLAAGCWHEDEPLYVYNIDTYVEQGELLPEVIKGDGFIPCFEASGEHWSFVNLDETGKAVEVREKKRISNHCSIGAYYFSSCMLYADLYRKLYDEQGHLEKGERYIAPLYNTLIEQGGAVYIQEIPPGKVHVLGTPEEVIEFEKM